jgi:hemerythrin-like domain-containing protein
MQLRRQTARTLHEEHVAVIGLLDRFERALAPLVSGPPGPEDTAWRLLLKQLETALRHEVTRHFALEEEQLFPRLREYGSGELADLLLEEHAVIREVAGTLLGLIPRAARRDLDPSDWRAFRVSGLDLVQRLGSHARMEEDALVPVVDEMLDEQSDLEIWNAHAAAC